MVEELRLKYKDNEFMLAKLDHYIERLPLWMQSVEEDHIKKVSEKHELQQKRDEFVIEFFKRYEFYYIVSSDTYVQRIDQEWRIVREYDIVHILNQHISKELSLSRYKLIHSILKRVKDTPLYSSATPYTTTMIVHQIPMRKEYAKFFLTIVGDILLNKKINEVYYIDSSYKQFLKYVYQEVYRLTQKSICDVFKYKYHDHRYENCRILYGKCSAFKECCMFDFINAAVHLSTKYGSSETYIHHPESVIQHEVLFLTRHTPETLLQYFLDTHTIPTPEKHITYKDMFFLWKIFLKQKGLPFVITHQNFKTLLTSLGKCEADMCMHCSPSTQADILKIKHFWDTHIQSDDNEYELNEIVMLYTQHEKTTLSVDILKDMIVLEYPAVSIHGDTVSNITCSLWNKTDDLDMLRDLCKEKNIVGIQCMYDFYEKYPFKYHVSKEYFEQYFISLA